MILKINSIVSNDNKTKSQWLNLMLGTFKKTNINKWFDGGPHYNS